MNDIFTVDARGLTCPQPVLETKKALEDRISGPLRVLVDNTTSRENVMRFARNQGCKVETQESGPEQFEITIIRCGDAPEPANQEELLPCPVPETNPLRNLVYIGNNCMGRGDDELGTKLMRGFLRTWIDSTPLPWRMVFINSGVKLTTIDEEAVEALSLLEEKGVDVLSCGTCLEHFNLKDKLRAGKVTNMFEIIESLNSATKVISPD
ncbi:MAG TPA: sulfurtransferase-like selenium metabolism protein YedF [Desulfomonilaceae bacterium]|nr:sulfurtransferase-like selenium metabolism protein YedF [Desulfomonilaceae bacterium]